MGTITTLHVQREHHTIAHELNSFLAYLEHQRGRATNTLRAYRGDLLRADAAIDQPLHTITLSDLERFLATIPEAKTRNRHMASLRQFFRWAEREGLVAENVAARIDPKQEQETLPRPIPEADLALIRRGIDELPQPFRLMLTILRETGMRAGEVRNLDVGDVCLEIGREGLRIREAKNRTERTVVLTADDHPQSLRGLRRHLRDLGLVAASTPLFCSELGTRVSYDALNYQWLAACKAVKLVTIVEQSSSGPVPARPRVTARYTMHQLRHTVATALIARLPEQYVARALGHKDPRSTRIYAQISDDQLRAVLAAHPRR